jgi:F-type H+-transporting ATPase subunit delta
MTLSALGKRYAHALADVVTKVPATSPEAVVSELRAFEAALKSSAELHNALTSPAVPPGRKRAVVGRIADKMGLTKIVRNFLFVLIDHRRVSLLNDIINSFELALEERLGFARAEVSSAQALTGPQRAQLNARLEKITGKQIRARFAVDESLIGGLVARIGSTVYDGSVRGQLDKLGRRLGTEA